MTSAILQIERVLYTAKAHTTGGRDGGASRTSDGRLDVKLSVPGTPGPGTNPEQLLAVGWSACFLSAIKLVAARQRIKLPPDVAVDAEVDLGTTDGAHLIQARLNVSLPWHLISRSGSWMAPTASVRTRKPLTATSMS